MTFKGDMKISMFSSDCGYEEEFTFDYSVECSDASKIEEAIEKKYAYLADNFHHQAGCSYGCTTGITIIEIDGKLTEEGILKHGNSKSPVH